MPAETSPRARQRLRYALAALGFAAIAAAATLASLRSVDWYDGLTLPSFAPPGLVSGLIWVMADLVTAIAFHKVLCRPDWMPDRPSAIRAFALQFGLKLVWLVVFFAARSPGAGLVAVFALLVAVVVTGRRFGRVDRMAGLCMAFYGVWVVFAAFVGLSIVIRS